MAILAKIKEKTEGEKSTGNHKLIISRVTKRKNREVERSKVKKINWLKS